MNSEKLKAELIEDEGRRTYPYPDTEGLLTAGIGHNLEAAGCSTEEIASWKKTGVPEATIDGWFEADIAKAVACCREVFCGFDSLPDEAQRVLVNMAFDLRYKLEKWQGLRCAVSMRDWSCAAREILDSEFARQAPERCRRLAARITGE